jgi:gamma-glutamyltranspeptidase/glutathione hydrolase
MGVMGGHMQPQGHVQMVQGLVDHGLNPQTVLDRPRWIWSRGLEAGFENSAPHGPGWPEALLADLGDRGHAVSSLTDPTAFGRGQIVLRLPGGGYAAGSDWRADGLALGY